MKKNDIILILVIVFVAAATLLITSFGKERGGYAVIEQNGEIVHRVALDSNEKDYVVDGENGYNIIRIGNGYAFFLEADCRDESCVAGGKLSKAGELAVCLPHRVVLRIEGGKSSNFDAISE